MKKGVLNNSAKFTGKQLYMTLFFDKVSDLTPADLLKKSFQHRCLPVSFVKFSGTNFLKYELCISGGT